MSETGSSRAPPSKFDSKIEFFELVELDPGLARFFRSSTALAIASDFANA